MDMAIHVNIVHGIGICRYCFDQIATGNNVYIGGNITLIVDHKSSTRTNPLICLRHNTPQHSSQAHQSLVRQQHCAKKTETREQDRQDANSCISVANFTPASNAT